MNEPIQITTVEEYVTYILKIEDKSKIELVKSIVEKLEGVTFTTETEYYVETNEDKPFNGYHVYSNGSWVKYFYGSTEEWEDDNLKELLFNYLKDKEKEKLEKFNLDKKTIKIVKEHLNSFFSQLK